MFTIRNVFKKLFRGGFFQAVLKVGSGNLIGQAIGIITTPILSRIYDDAAYGDRLIIVSTAAIVCNIATLGLNSAIMKPEDDEESRRVFSAAFYANFLVSAIVTAASLVLNRTFHLVEVSGSYPIALLFLFLYMVCNTTKTLLQIYTNRKGRYNRLFFNPIIGAVANILLAIPLGLNGFGYSGFMITVIVTDLIQIIHMAWKDSPFYRHFGLPDFWYVLKQYKDYIFFQYPSNFLRNTGNEYPTQFLGRNFSSSELGSYSMCLNILKYPLRLIATPISTVYFRTATEYHRQGKDLAGFTYKMVSRTLLISFFPVVLCCLFSEKIFAFVLGSNWAMAGTIAAIKAVEYVMLFCADCISYCRVSIGKQKSNLFYSAIKLGVIVVFSTAGLFMFHNLLGTIIMITVGNTLLNILDIAISFFHLDKKCCWKYIALSTGYTILMSGVVAAKYFL